MKILLGHPMSAEAVKGLNESSGFQVDCLESMEDRVGQLKARIADYNGLVVMGTKADRELFELGKKLKVVANFGVGYDNIDTAAAKDHGVAVSNTPTTTSGPTATFAMGLIISTLRKIVLNDRRIRGGELPVWNTPSELGTSLDGKTLGIIGMGRIGKALAARALPFDMKILYYNRNRYPAEVEAQYQAKYASMDDLLKQSDIISVHTPLNANTKNLIGEKELGLMKASAFIINTARGGVIDHDALLKALKEEKIAGAGLDVFPEEPKLPEGILDFENVVVTPHNGTGTREARRNMFGEAFGNVVAFLKGEEMTSRVA